MTRSAPSTHATGRDAGVDPVLAGVGGRDRVPGRAGGGAGAMDWDRFMGLHTILTVDAAGSGPDEGRR